MHDPPIWLRMSPTQEFIAAVQAILLHDINQSRLVCVQCASHIIWAHQHTFHIITLHTYPNVSIHKAQNHKLMSFKIYLLKCQKYDYIKHTLSSCTHHLVLQLLGSNAPHLYILGTGRRVGGGLRSTGTEVWWGAWGRNGWGFGEGVSCRTIFIFGLGG